MLWTLKHASHCLNYAPHLAYRRRHFWGAYLMSTSYRNSLLSLNANPKKGLQVLLKKTWSFKWKLCIWTWKKICCIFLHCPLQPPWSKWKLYSQTALFRLHSLALSWACMRLWKRVCVCVPVVTNDVVFVQLWILRGEKSNIFFFLPQAFRREILCGKSLKNRWWCEKTFSCCCTDSSNLEHFFLCQILTSSLTPKMQTSSVLPCAVCVVALICVTAAFVDSQQNKKTVIIHKFFYFSLSIALSFLYNKYVKTIKIDLHFLPY